MATDDQHRGIVGLLTSTVQALGRPKEGRLKPIRQLVRSYLKANNTQLSKAAIDDIAVDLLGHQLRA
jgi:hypothetical protein